MVVVNVAKAWVKQGHAVTVICQDRQAGTLDFVDEFIPSTQNIPDHPPEPGQLRVVVPEINDLLPVYVFDHYEGYRVKTIPDMTVEEIETHISMIAATLKKVCAQGVDRVLANHALLSPVIAARVTQETGTPYDVKLHGSAMEFTLAPHPETMKYAIEGLAGARRIIAGTNYIRTCILELFSAERKAIGLDQKLCVIPLGMDPETFYISTNTDECQANFLDAVRQKISENNNGRTARAVPDPNGQTPEALHAALIAAGETYDQRIVDADLPNRWRTISANEPVVIYFGKFLQTKGVGELMAAIPSVLASVPTARFIFAGFGAYREHLEGMLQAYASGDRPAFDAYAQAGEFALEADTNRTFRQLTAEELERIIITGILDHEMLSHLLPLASVTLAPSKLAEAFGLVAVEAMAAGALPLCSDHSGLKDVIDQISETAPQLGALMKLKPGAHADLSHAILSALQALYPNGFTDSAHQQAIARELRSIAIDQFSWDSTASRLVAL